MKPQNDNETVVWLKIGPHFIDEKTIRSVSRSRKSTVISFVTGEDITVDVDYDKVLTLMKSGKK